jgi:Holliday junction resolvase RusA-like endonuclease
MERYRDFIRIIFDASYPTASILSDIRLYGKVFWIHKTGDDFFHRRDADNFSKPLWDTMNKHVYDDDEQIQFRQAAKLQYGDHNSLTINIVDMDDDDYTKLLEFHLDPGNTESSWLYIEIGEFKHSQVKFGEEWK